MKVMKKITLTGIILALALMGFAQEQEREFRTVVGYDNFRISGMGGPFMQFTAIDGQFAHMLGGGGAVLLGDLWFGGYGLGLTNTIYVDNNRFPDYTVYDRLNVSHGGFWMGYSLFGESPIHLAISTLMGWGNVSVVRDEYYDAWRDGIFVVCPTVEVELNLTQFFRLSAGATYNIYSFVDTNNLPGYSNSDLSAPGGFLSFKFGWF
jgi:hypothetical protein